MPAKPSANITFPSELDSLEPIEICDPLTDMKAAFVGRYARDYITTPWKVIGLCGIYVLLSDLKPDGSFDAYVGYTKTGFERRLFAHDESKDYWTQAILFTRPTLTSTQAQWLEGEIVRLLKAGNHVNVHNIRYTGDETLPDGERGVVENLALFVMRVLFLRGYRSSSLAREVTILENKSLPGEISQEAALTSDDAYMLNRLKEWRKQTAIKSGLSLGYVFKNEVLETIVRIKPANLNELGAISGIGPKKLQDWGLELLSVTNSSSPSDSFNEPEVSF